MLTIPQYAISVLEQGYQQRGPSVEALEGTPGITFPDRVMIVDAQGLGRQLPRLSGYRHAVLMDLPYDTPFDEDSPAPISLGMSVINVEQSVFLGLSLVREDDALTLPMCPEKHADVLSWMLKSNALIVGHSQPTGDDNYAMQIVAALGFTQRNTMQMSLMLLNALRGWPMPNMN